MKADGIRALRGKIRGSHKTTGKMTQKDLAEHIGVDIQTVQSWEQKRKRPPRLARRELYRLETQYVSARNQAQVA